MRKVFVAIVTTLVLGSAFALLTTSNATVAQDGTPVADPPVIIASEVLGQASPIDVTDPLLALGRVTIMPGAAIPIHHHPGTQIGVVVQGTLTYTVVSGSVEWQHASAAKAPTTISAGETVQVPAGDALIENPGAIHQGRNEGTVPTVIYVSTLFPAGSPRAILDAATPTP